MAHVDCGRSDRGQLILVTGLLVAVAMVSLVLLLNTAIYTENLASRGTDQSGREAIEYHGAMVDAVGGLLDAENAVEPGTWTTLNETTRGGIREVDNQTIRAHATRGTVVGIDWSTLRLHEGRLIRQTNSSRNFSDASGANTDWKLATGVAGTRSFSMNVSQAPLEPTNRSDAMSDPAFRVEVTDGGATWHAIVYENRTTGDLTLATDDGTSTVEHCTVATPPSSVPLNLTAGTLDGGPCPGYEWAEGVTAPYDVSFENGNNAEGTYALTVNGTGVVGANLNDGGPSPYSTPAVYSAAFDVTFETPTLVYRSGVRVAPGEPP